MTAFDYLDFLFLLSVIPWTVFFLYGYKGIFEDKRAWIRVILAVRAIVIVSYLWPVAMVFFFTMYGMLREQA